PAVALRRPSLGQDAMRPSSGQIRSTLLQCQPTGAVAKNRCSATHCARLPQHGKHCCACRRPLLVASCLAPSAGLVVVQASRWAMRIQRTKTMASKQPLKQAKSAAKADTGEANKPARNRQRAPRRRVSQARSGSTATETSSAAAQAGVAPEGASESIELSKNTTR